jgi:hypothetical protein
VRVSGAPSFVGISEGGDDHQSRSNKLARKQLEPQQCWHICPVQVIENNQHGLGLGDGDEKLGEAIKDTELVLCRVRTRGDRGRGNSRDQAVDERGYIDRVRISSGNQPPRRGCSDEGARSRSHGHNAGAACAW